MFDIFNIYVIYLMFNCFLYRYIDFIFIMVYDMYGFWEGKIGLYFGLYVFNNDLDKKLNMVNKVLLLFCNVLFWCI